MPDITMCASKDCPKRDTCKRSEASGTIADEYRQSWFSQEPGDFDACGYYWPINVSGKE